MDKNTKIVATLGPATSNEEAIKQLVEAGVNVFRLNFSHGKHETQGELIRIIRKVEEETSRHLGIMADLQGPKFRLGQLQDGKVELKKGDVIKLVTSTVQKIGDSKVLTTGTPHADLSVRHIAVGESIMINDGTVTIKVTERLNKDEVKCVVVVPGTVSERQGLNVPNINVRIPAITDKDQKDAVYALKQNVDFVALSFVQHGEDVLLLKKLLQEHAGKDKSIPKIISKIEKPLAIQNIDEIIAVSDGLMIARGDLSVECSFEKVPSYQKMLIQKCNRARIPVITATQMLHSMMSSPSPTRAEVSDVANAVHDGSDAVMLSGETAMGAFPYQAVSAMSAIITEAESVKKKLSHSSTYSYEALKDARYDESKEHDHAIAVSAATAAHSQKCSALVVVCNDYELGVFLSKIRSPCPIIAVTFDPKISNALALSYGVYSFSLPDPVHSFLELSADSFLLLIDEKIRQLGWLQDGDLIVFCSCGSSSPLTYLPLLRHTLQLTRFGDHKYAIEARGGSELKSSTAPSPSFPPSPPSRSFSTLSRTYRIKQQTPSYPTGVLSPTRFPLSKATWSPLSWLTHRSRPRLRIRGFSLF